MEKLVIPGNQGGNTQHDSKDKNLAPEKFLTMSAEVRIVEMIIIDECMAS